MKFKAFTLSVILVVVFFIFYSCVHKSTVEPEPLPVISTTGVTPVVNPADSVCFSEQILPLLISSCGKSGCHNDTSRSAGIELTSYSTVKSTISGNLLMQVIQDSGPQGMPPFPMPKLSNVQVSLIQTWVNQGMKNGVDCQGPCDTTNITFSGTVFPVIVNNCMGCHSTTIPTLKNYNEIKAQVDNGKIICTIKHLSGCTPMPLNSPPLSACKIKQIEKWVKAGAPNN
ncbi:MAG: hypothetical protein H0W61_02985 [Bacteroidetes bacterium]|nr:hypothetical protein [Bacteroidota bacterium]